MSHQMLSGVLLLSAASSFSPCVRAQAASVLTIAGENQVPHGLERLRSAGDVDRDGFTDMIASYPQNHTTNGYLLGSAIVYSGRDGRSIYRYEGVPARKIGRAVAGVGDVNRDGYSDFAISGLDPVGAGSVKVYSGKNGVELYDWVGSPYDFVGSELSGVGDLNGDGHDDVLVGSLLRSSFGEVRAFSGRDGKVLYTISGNTSNAPLGAMVRPAGDLDQDGVPDFYVLSGFARLQSYSGKSGSLIRELKPPVTVQRFYSARFSNVGDVDGDSLPDVGWGGLDGTTTAGICMILSTKTGKVLHFYRGQLFDGLASVCGVGDVDDDGRADFVVGATQAGIGSQMPGYAKGYSGRTGKLLFDLTGSSANEAFAYRLTTLDDQTGDGKVEFAVASSGFRNPNNRFGQITVYSPVRLGLEGAPSALSSRTPGSQTLRIDAGVSNAKQDYWIFGSLSGRRPGTLIGGFRVPLNYDPYTDFTIGHLSLPLFTSFRGQLDASGRAQASFNVISGLPPLPEFTLYHAGVVFDSKGAIRMVTNGVSLRLVR